MTSVKSGADLSAIGYLFGRGTCLGFSDARLLEKFVTHRDERAFETLVARHGKSVLAVCRDVLRDPHDAEDAFQATFLVLVQKAGTLWVSDSLAPWLHRVARRVAVEANRRKAQRRAVQPCGFEIEAVGMNDSESRDARYSLLHEEIDRLPEKYRVPIILCDLQELTRDEAAGQLGWPPGTVAGRLARARALLRDRLTRRGRLEAGALPIAAAGGLKPCSVPASWTGKTVQLAILVHSARPAAARLTSAAGWALARRVVRTMVASSLKKVAILSIIGASATVACTLAVATSSPLPAAGAFAPALRAPSVRSLDENATGHGEGAGAALRLSGTLHLPDGKPAGNARLFYSTRDHVQDHGHIRAEARLDGEGRFSLELPSVDGAWPGLIGSGTLWAYRPGSFVPTVSVYRGALPQKSVLSLPVGPSAGALFEVHDPDGKPVAGAQIEPKVIDRHHAQVPDGLAREIANETVTDARGRAVMAAFLQEEIRSIVVAARGYGRQEFGFGLREISADPKIVRLQPVGRLKGRLIGDSRAIRRCPLTVAGFSSPDNLVRFSTILDSATDDQGRFEISEIAAGLHGVRTADRCDFPWYARLDRGLVEVKPGETTEVVLSMRPAVRVHGLVREKTNGKPIAGMRMAVAIMETGAMTTGPDGTYHGFMAPGATFISPRTVPPGYAMPLYGAPQVLVPGDTADFTLPPYELSRAGDVRGKVVDERAQPAAGAEVVASWKHVENGRGPQSFHLAVRTGPGGGFVFPGVPEEANVTLRARYRGRHTAEARHAQPGAAVVLHLASSDDVSLAGQVVDLAGRPVAGASIHLRRQRQGLVAPNEDPNGLISDRVELQSGSCVIADAHGRFRTPRELDAGEQYAAIATAPGYVPRRTPWTCGDAGAFTVIQLSQAP